MDDNRKTKEQLIQELDELRRRNAELEKSETEHKRAEGIIQSRLRMLTAANKNTLTMEEFLQVALDEIEGLTGSTIGFYHFLESDQEMLSLQNWLTNTLRNMCTAEGKGSHYPISQAGVWVDCVSKRCPIIHNDYASLSYRKGLPPGHAPVVRELVVPIMRDSQIVAIIGVGNKPSDYNKTDVDITSLLGDFSWEIVERKRVEEDLKKAHKVTRNILNSISDAFFSLDDNLTVTFFNQAAERLLGRISNEVLGCNLFDAFPEARGSIFEDRYREALRTKQFISFETYFDIEPYRNWYEVRAYPQENGISVFFQVTTERKRAEEALQQRSLELKKLNDTLEQRVLERTTELEKANESLRHLSSRLLFAEEDEKKRIAREVHDVLGSSLSAIKFKMEDIIERNRNLLSSQVIEGLENLSPVIKETIDNVRRIQADLRPPLLDDLGVVATLSWYCRRFETIYSGIKVEQTVTVREEEVPENLKIPLFRITQEALNNIGKHAKANSVDLGLRKVDGTIELSIQDNGVGFNQLSWSSYENSEKGLGLSSMEERTKFSGGSFSFDSAIGKGTVYPGPFGPSDYKSLCIRGWIVNQDHIDKSNQTVPFIGIIDLHGISPIKTTVFFSSKYIPAYIF